MGDQEGTTLPTFRCLDCGYDVGDIDACTLHEHDIHGTKLTILTFDLRYEEASA